MDFDPITGAPSHIMAAGKFLAKAKPDAKDPYDTVRDFVSKYEALFGHGTTALNAGQARVTREDVTAHNGMRTVVWQQEVAGVPVFQTILKANLTKNGDLVTLGSHFMGDPVRAAGEQVKQVAQPPLDAGDAMSYIAQNLGGELQKNAVTSTTTAPGADKAQKLTAPGYSDTTARLSWVPMDENTLRLAWQVETFSLQHNEMFRMLVDVEKGTVLVRQSITADISTASYRVYAKPGFQPYDSPTPFAPGYSTPSSVQPAEVSRNLLTLDAVNTTASPNGWIDDGGTQTLGNNVDAHTDTNADNIADLPRPTSSTRTFDFPLNLTQDPSTYKDAAVTNLFYLCNYIHDKYYSLGFTESAGNFQTNNFGRGGNGNDAVQADAQDGSGTDNANFSTPSDGSPGRMQMYVFTGPNPYRDGDLDHEVVIHEYTHGLSNRLVGGGVGISQNQTQGMGEGWSDFYGLCLLSEATDDPNGNYAAGGYATKNFYGLADNYYYGIRRYPYSTNLAKNPLTFKDIDPSQASSHTGIPRSPVVGSTANEVHNEGEVWCVTLWDMRANLIAKYGWAAGNQLALQLTTDAMKLCPVNPNMLQSRDAIIQADLVSSGGANRNELWTAFAKRGMGSSATSPASTTTTGLTEAYDFPDDLSITPFTSFAASGTIGGPFSPAAQTFTLTNTGATSLDWTASKTQPWITLSATSGTLEAGETATVDVTFNTAANGLAPGSYTDTVSFTNITSGAVIGRGVSLTVDPYTITVLSEPFATSTLGPQWTVTGTNTYRTQVTGDNQPNSGPYHLTMDSSLDYNYSRNEATLLVDLSGRQHVQLSFWAKGFNDEGDGPPPSPFPSTGYDFDGVAISADGGTNWYEVQGLRAISGIYTKYVVNLDPVMTAHGLSYGSNFKIRFNQYDNYGISTDGIAIDDIVVAETINNTLSLSLPDSTTEGASALTATLSVTPTPSADLTVALSSNSPDGTVPATVLVPAGAASVTFPVTITDDTDLDGTQAVTISAVAATYATGVKTLLVHDNETTTLAVDIPSSAIEGSSPPQGSVSVPTPVAKPVTVTLVSDNLSAQVPATVTIPAGKTTALFSVTLPNDNLINGSRSATIVASVQNWTSGSDTLTVLDDENTNLSVTVLASGIVESDPPYVAAARASITGVLSSDLVISLASSDSSELTIPATVTIPAGSTQATFNLTPVNDAEPDGPQTVTITASSSGFVSGTATVIIGDDDSPPVPFNPQPAHLSSNNPADSDLAWSAANGNAVVNGDFESGSLSGWTVSHPGTTAFRLQNGTFDPPSTDGPLPPYAGAYSMIFNGPSTGTFTMQQDVAVPLDGAAPVLQWAQQIRNNSTSFSDPTQQFRVELRNPVTNAVLATLFATHPGDTLLQGWTTQSFNLTAYRGQVVRLAFTSQHGTTLNVLLDNIQITSGSAATSYDVYFGTNANPGPAELLGNTASKAWTLPPLTPGTTYYWQVVSRQDALSTPGPVWRFTVPAPGAPASYAWAPITSAQQTGAPFTVSITAKDALGNTATSFNDSVSLSTSLTQGGKPSILITEASPHATDEVEFTNVSALPVDISGWKIVIGDFTSFPGAMFSFTIPAGTTCAPGQAFIYSDASTATGTFPSFKTSPNNINWGFSSRGWCALKNNLGEVVDFVCFVNPTLGINLPEPLTTDMWKGGPLAAMTGNPIQYSWQRIGSADTDTAADWQVRLLSIGTPNAGLTLPFTSGTTAPRIIPVTTGNFTNGIWSGPVMLQDAASKVKLRARDASGNYGDSSTFNVTAASGTLALTAGTTAAEGDGLLTGFGTVTLPSAAAADVVVNFNLSVSGEATVASVTIPAGSTSAPFDLAVIDDTLLDGPRLVTIEASAAGYAPASRSVSIADNETAALTLTAPASLTEGQGTLTGAITIISSTPAANDLTLTLTSSDTTEITVPSTILLPAGQTTVTAPLTVINDTLLDGPQSVTLTAGLTGWTSGTAAVTVNDNESPSITVILPPSFTEGAGLAAIGSVTLGGTAIVNVTVNLASSDTSEITLPTSVTVLAGQASATFDVTVVDDPDTDGTQPVTITASASGMTDGTVSTQVKDNDLHHFTVAAIGASQIRGIAFPVTLTARSVDDLTLTGFTGTATLSASNGGSISITPTLTGAFSSGVWTGNVTVNETAAGVLLTATSGTATGTSNAFDVVAGALDHFDIAAIPGTQQANTPFTATVTAKDAQNNTIPGYTGPAALRAFGSTTQRILSTGTTTSSLPFQASYPSSRTQAIYTAAEIGGAQRISGLSLFINSLPQPTSQFTVRMKHTPLTNYNLSANRQIESSGWTQVYEGPLNVQATGWLSLPFTVPFDYNGTDSLLVDLIYRNSYTPTGTGTVRATTKTDTRVIYQLGTGDPKTWGTSYFSSSTSLPDLRLDVRPLLPLTPAQAQPFTNGIWSGMVAVGKADAGVTLLSLDVPTGKTGASNTFAVTSSGSLSISLASTAAEGGAALNGTVSIPSSSASDVAVTLTPSFPADVTLPGSVIIPAGSTSAPFTLAVVDDALVEGNETVQITATTPGFDQAVSSLTITDNEVVTLTVTLPATGTEGTANPGSGSVTASSAPVSDTLITLASNDTTEFTVPATVTLPAGQTTVSFTPTVVDDTLIDGPQTVTVSATVPGWIGGSASITVQDNEAAALTMSLYYSSLDENAGTYYTVGSVNIPGTLPTPLTVNLASSDLTEATLPSSVTIPAGSTSAYFSTTIINDTEADGTQTVTFTASAAGFTSSSKNISILDDDVHHFTWGSITGPQTKNSAFSVSITARDVNNVTLSNYFGTPALSATSAGGALSVTPATATFSYGTWTGTVTIPATATGVTLAATDGSATGLSNAFDVTIGALHHFGISTIASPQMVSTPLSATITAQDAGGNTVTSYTGTAQLSAAQPAADVTTGSGTGTASYPLYTYYEDCRTQSIYTPAEVGSARLLTALALNVSSVSTQVMNNFTIRIKHTPKADYTSSASWDATGWTTVFQANQSISSAGWNMFTFTTPFDYNGTDNLMVDISFNNSSYTSSSTTYYTTASTSRTIYYDTDSGYGDPLTWSGTSSPTPYTTTSLPNIRFSSSTPLAMTPTATGSFVNGVWTGNVSLQQTSSGAVLYAVSGATSGTSNTFAVNSSGSLSMTLAASVTEGGTPASGTITLPVMAPAGGIVVTLSSQTPLQATLSSATITIPAGSTTGSFSVSAVNDTLLDGTQPVIITASAPAYASASSTIAVNDNETATLSLTLPSSVTEGIAPGSATVTISQAPDLPLAVTLSSSRISRLTVPATVTIPAGQTSAAVALTVVDNAIPDLSQSVIITATSTGLTTDTASLNVLDNDNTFTTTTNGTVEGNPAYTGTVTLVGAAQSALTITISSNDITEALLAPTTAGTPAASTTISIAAGATSASFAVFPQNDPDKDGQQTVTLTFESPGFVTSTRAVLVTDNEVDHYYFDGIANPQNAKGSFSATVRARNIDDINIGNFSGTVNLTAASLAGPMAMTPLTATLATGSSTFSTSFAIAQSSLVITATDSAGNTGSSNAFNVLATGSLSKFTWGTITSPKQSDAPFAITVTAADSASNPVTDYAGPASLGAFTTATAITTGSGTGTWSQPLNAASTYVRTQSIYLKSEMGSAARRLTTLAFNVASSSSTTLNNFTIRLKHTTASSYSTASWDATGWTTVYVTNRAFNSTGQTALTFTTPFDYNGTDNLMVDVSFLNASTGTAPTVYYTTASASRTCYLATTSTSSGPPTTWSGTSPAASLTTSLANLQFGNATPLAFTPATTGSFASGVWSGNVSVRDTGSSVFLSALDPASGVFANSGTFTVSTTGTLALAFSAARQEGEGVVSSAGTVTLPSAPASNVTVSLASLDTTEFIVPATVTVLAGQTSASFAVTVVDDSIIDGDQIVTVQASAPGYTRTTATATVRDNDGGTLTLTGIPAEVLEGALTSGTATITASVASPGPRTITLASSNTLRITVPATVTLAANATAATFTYTIVNDSVNYGSQSVTTTASAPGWTSGIATTLVDDNDALSLSLSMTSSVTEGATSTTGTVSLSSTSATPVTVTLASTDPSSVTVPASVTIAAGSTSATFTMAFPDNALTDGQRSVYITANSAGLKGAIGTTVVKDNDVHHYAISTITSPQTANAPFSITITAKDVADNTISITQPGVNLSATGSSGAISLTPAVSGALTSGSWTGQVTLSAIASGITLTATDSQSRTGVSNVFSTSYSTLDHFAWATVPSPQTVSAPFNATVTAKDSYNNTVASFTGSASLTSFVQTGETLVGTGTGTSLKPFDTSYDGARSQMIYLPSEIGGAKLITGMSLNVTTIPGLPLTRFAIRLKHTNATSMATGQNLDNSGLTTVYSNASEVISSTGWRTFRFSTPFSYDGSKNLLVDMVFDNATSGTAGYCQTTTISPSRHLAAANPRSSGWGDPYAWVGANNFSQTSLPNVKFQTGATSPVLPATTGSFAAGTWSGPVMVTKSGTGIQLQASASGMVGGSNTFDVTASGALSLSLAATATEGAAPLTATLGIATAPVSDFVVTLASTVTTAATVPATVTIPAGQTSVTFPVTVVDDTFLDGPQSTIIVASSPGYDAGVSTLNVLDNETTTITLTLPPTLAENVSSTTGTISLATAVGSDITLPLTSSDPSTLMVPASVTIPAGSSSATFSLTPVDNSVIDFTRNVTVTTSMQGWTGASATLAVTDNETAYFFFALTGSAAEGSAPLTGYIYSSYAVKNATTIALSSSDTTAATVPATVTLAAGSSSAPFTLTIVDDTLKDGYQNCTITASAAGFPSASSTFTVTDNDVHNFLVSTISSPQMPNQPFDVTFTARDVNNEIIYGYAGSPTLSAKDGATVLTITPATTTGFYTGTKTQTVTISSLATNAVITATDPTSGGSGSSNAFAVSVGALDHFAVSSVASTISNGSPQAVTVTAKDVANNTITSFNQTANLSISNDSANVTTGTGTSTWSIPLGSQSRTQRMQVIYLPSEVGTARILNNLALYVGTVPGSPLSNFTIRMKHSSLTSYGTISWDSTGWTTVYQAATTISATGWKQFDFTTPFTYDGTSSLMIDFSYYNAATGSTQGYVQYTSASAIRTVLAQTDTDYGSPLAWTGTSPTPNSNTVVPNVRFGTTSVTVPVTPTVTGSFTNGAWSGTFTPGGLASNVRFRATNGTATGATNLFTVNNAVLSVTLPASAVESAGSVSGTVSISSAQASPLTVSLSSSDTTEAQPATSTVTIPAGSTSVGFTLNIINDTLRDGSQNAIITASATGTTSGTATISVTDDDVDNFFVSAIGSQVRNAPFSVTFTARDVNNVVITGYNGSPVLTALNGSTALTVSPGTVTGFSSGVKTQSVTLGDFASSAVLTLTDPTTGGKGSSSAFVVTYSTAARYAWSTISTPSAGVPFSATLTAQDKYGNTAGNYSGTTSLSVLKATSIGNASTIWSYPLHNTDFNGRTQIICTAAELGAAKTIKALSLNVTSYPTSALTGTLYIRMKHTSKSDYSSGAAFETSGWTTCYQSSTAAFTGWNTFNFSTPFSYDGSQNVLIDLAFTTSTASGNALVSATDTGSPLSIAYSTTSAGDPLLYSFNGTTSTLRPDFILGSDAGFTPSPSATGAFTAGVWTGNVTLPAQASNLMMQAVSGTVSGISNIFSTSAPLLSITVPSTASESAGSVSGTVSLTAALASPLVVNLSSSDTTEAQPAISTVTIAAGTTSVAFTLNIINDTLRDGAQSAVITASAAGTNSSTATISVTDDDVDNFLVSAVGTQIRNVPFTVTFTARDVNNVVITGYSGTPVLTALDGATSLTVSPATVSGFSSGVKTQSVTMSSFASSAVLTLTDSTTGGKGSSSAFFVTFGALSKFAWSPINSPQVSNVAFPVSVTAQDAVGNTVTSYSGTAALSAPISTSTQNVGSGSYNTNAIPFNTLFSKCRSQQVLLASEVGAAGRINSLALNFTAVPVANTFTDFTIRLKHTSRTGYSGSGDFVWESTGFTTAYQGSPTINATGYVTFVFTTPFNYDGVSNLMVDFSYRAATVNSNRPTITSTTRGNTRTINYYISATTYGEPLTWTGTSPPAFSDGHTADIQLSMGTYYPLSPATTTAFTNGVWSGNLTVGTSTSSMSVIATDAATTATSNSFEVLPTAFSLSAEPTFTGGLTNALYWNQPASGLEYEVQCSPTPDFASSVSSGYITGPTSTFTTLVDGKIYYYRARMRRQGALTWTSDWTPQISSTQDATVPIVTIPALTTSSTSATLSGTTQDTTSGISSVMVAGVAATTSNGFASWTKTVPSLVDGSNSITVTASDNASPPNSTSVTAIIYRIAATTGDANGNGISNLMEHALGIPAGTANPQSMLPAATVQTDAGSGDKYLTMQFRRRIQRAGLSYTVETSSNLSTWDNTGASVQEVGTVPTGDGATELVTIRVTPAMTGSNPKKFVRLSVTTN